MKAHAELTPFQWFLQINWLYHWSLVVNMIWTVSRQLMKLLLILAWLRMSWLVSMDITDYIAVIWTPFNEHLIYHCTYQLHVQLKSVTFPGLWLSARYLSVCFHLWRSMKWHYSCTCQWISQYERTSSGSLLFTICYAESHPSNIYVYPAKPTCTPDKCSYK